MKRLAVLLFVASLAATACGGTSTAADSATAGLKPATEGVPGVVVVPVPGRNHVKGHVDYPSSPPAGGNHNPVWQNCGVYTKPIANENGVHSLEHGAVWITYQPTLAAAQVATLQKLTKANSYALLSPFEGIKSPVVASAWGKQLALPSADDPRLAVFLRTYLQGPQTPEPGAACTGGTGTPQQ